MDKIEKLNAGKADMEGQDSVDKGNIAWEPEITNFIRRGNKRKGYIDAMNLTFITSFQHLVEFEDDLDSKKYILVGAKGTGKSLALARKASKFGRYINRITVPRYYPYFSAFVSNSLSVSLDKKSEVSQYCNHYWWVQIWTLAISTIFIHALKNYGETPMGTYLIQKRKFAVSGFNAAEEFFNSMAEALDNLESAKQEGTTVVLNAILSRNFDANVCQDWFQHLLRSELVLKSEESCGLFIDQVDEAFNEYRKTPEGQQLSIWEAAQNGLIDASGTISTITSDAFRVFASIRAEAFRSYSRWGTKGPLQKGSTCVEIVYSVDDLEKIFVSNINQTPPGKLASKGGSPRSKFFGVEQYEYPYIINEMEDPIGWVRRHTLGSPRELVFIGQKISLMPPLDRSSRTLVSEVINDAASEVLKEYKQVMIPPWDLSILDFYSFFKHNALCPNDISAINSEARKLDVIRGKEFDPLKYLYNNGFLGTPKLTDTKRQSHSQYFLDITKRAVDKNLPRSNFYLLHPVLYSDILSTLSPSEQEMFHNPSFIVGDGYACPKTLKAPKIIVSIDIQNVVANISYHHRMEKAWVFPEEIQSCTIPDLAIDDHSNVDQYFIYALLIAIYTKKSNSVDEKDIYNAIEALISDGICKPTVKQLDTKSYYEEKMREFTTAEHPHFFRKSKHFLNRPSLHGDIMPIKYKLNNGEGKLHSFRIQDLSYDDILVRYC